MNREYHKWSSQALGRDMELLVFGHAGMPIIVFPTSMGRFFQFEDMGMIGAIESRINGGQYQAYCVDSVDAESWYNKAVHPRERIFRHMKYEDYILSEVVPFIRRRNGATRVGVTGCSFGGYHSVNFALRHPDLVATAISMGGAFDIHQFLDGYYDQNAYFHCPPDFLPNLTDDWFLNRLRHDVRLILATGENDICLAENHRLSRILNEKGIPHWLDVWGSGTGHDWPWWRQMAVKFF